MSVGCIAEVEETVGEETVGEAGDQLEVDVSQGAIDQQGVGDGPVGGDPSLLGNDLADPEPDPWAPKPPSWLSDPEPDPWDPWGEPDRSVEADQAHQSS